MRWYHYFGTGLIVGILITVAFILIEDIKKYLED